MKSSRKKRKKNQKKDKKEGKLSKQDKSVPSKEEIQEWIHMALQDNSNSPALTKDSVSQIIKQVMEEQTAKLEHRFAAIEKQAEMTVDEKVATAVGNLKKELTDKMELTQGSVDTKMDEIQNDVKSLSSRITEAVKEQLKESFDKKEKK